MNEILVYDDTGNNKIPNLWFSAYLVQFSTSLKSNHDLASKKVWILWTQ